MFGGGILNPNPISMNNVIFVSQSLMRIPILEYFHVWGGGFKP